MSNLRRIALAAVMAAALFAVPAFAQDNGQAEAPAPQPEAQRSPTTAQKQWKDLDSYLDKHPDVKQEIMKDPNLVNNPEWLGKHPHIQKFVQNHPAAAARLQAHPSVALKEYRRGEAAQHRGAQPMAKRGNPRQ